MNHAVVSHEEWIAARTEFLRKEKEFFKFRDQIAAARRALPWEMVEKHYVFEGTAGPISFSEVFDGQSQLIVYHLMFSPEWDEPCENCSFWADHFDSVRLHLPQRDANLVAISRAPVEKLDGFKKRMGWKFPWYSSGGNTFNFDLNASFSQAEVDAQSGFYNYRTGDPECADREGISVFYKDDRGTIYHTYSTYARGIDLMNNTYNYVDITPMGRNEGEHPLGWVKFHDEYPSQELQPTST